MVHLPQLLLLLACHQPPGARSGKPELDDSAADSGPDSPADSTVDSADSAGPDALHLHAATSLALPFVSVGDPAPSASLTVTGGPAGSVGPLSFTVTGDFAVSGDETSLAPGESRALDVRYTGALDEPSLNDGLLKIAADDQTISVSLAAVVGDADLPDADWTSTATGVYAISDLPSAPFPYGSASYDDSSVLIFVPTSLTDQGDLGVVTHIHGHSAILREVVAAQYIVEQHALSGRDAILIVPQGPEDAADSDFGRLDTAAGHAALVRDAVSLLYRDGLITRPVLGEQVITSHSGGYLCTSYIVQQGGLPITAVHLFDSLYAQESVFQDFAVDGGLLRSVYTSGGGTDDNNADLADTLAREGVSVNDSFTDADLYDSDVIIGYSGASHSGSVWAERAYARWLVGSGLRRSPLAPPELDAVLSDGVQATVRWRPDRGAEGQQIAVEGSEDGETWTVLGRSTTNSATVTAARWIRVRGALDSYGEPAPSDRYAGSGGDWLIVDGFDRVLGGSWTLPTHDFTARVGSALGSASSAANEAISSGEVALSDYDGVVWLLGDESTADATFDETEQAAITAYVAGGGRIIVSGAELGYATDSGWLSSTLHARYVSDDAGTDQAGDYRFGVQYDEDYPDVLSGSETLWSYSTGGAAAVGWNGQVIAVGFGLENLSDADLDDAMAELVGWLDAP